MKIRKQFQKQAEEPALVEAGEKKLCRQVSVETETGGRLLLGKSLFGSSPGASRTVSSTGGGASGGGQAPVDQTTVQESLEESNSSSCRDWTLHQDDHKNARRKYARRSLRSAGVAGTLVVQPDGTHSNGKAVDAKVRSIPSRGDQPGHPSEQPEGSLLHCLYLHLLAAGSEGMTLKEIFTSFTSQTRFSSLRSNWRDQLKSCLATNPYFKQVKARYFLSEQLQPPPRASRHLMDLNLEPSHCDTPLSASPDPSVVNNNREGVQTRRKTYERTIEAVLNESAVEFQKTQKKEEIGDGQSKDELSTASLDVPGSRGLSKKRKSSSHHGVEPVDFRHTGAVPGSLKAMQARIVAETGVHSGVRCSRKDGSNHHSKWQCPMMAMEGRSLCQHHNFLSERKKARYKKAKLQAAGKKSTRQAPSLITQLQELSKPPRESVGNDEVCTQINELPPTHRIVRTRSDAHTNGSLAESANNTQTTTEDMNSETEAHLEPGRHSFRSTCKPQMYLAAKKTAERTPLVAPAPGKSVKKQSVPLIRPPSIPPLPMLCSVRRKSMKSRPPQQPLL